MSSQDVQLLMEMGFNETRAERALEVTGNRGVEPAMEWLLAHVDEVVSNDNSSPTLKLNHTQSETKPAEEEVMPEGEQLAKSLKCDECGRLFRSQPEVEFHAAKSGHSSFSESTEEKKPLTEDEKKEQLRKLEEKMKQKRTEREQTEKQEAIEREKLRIKSGKEMIASKKKFEDAEMKKLVDQRKREKMEEKLARDRVKSQIEQDKQARRAKYGGEEVPPSTPPVAPVVIDTPPKVDYKQTRLQIRLTNGASLTQTFGSKEQLSAVRLYIEMNRTDSHGPFALMTSFPKKVFEDDDYEKPLDELGLLPAAVIIVSRVHEAV